MTETISKQDLEDFSKRLKNWRELDRSSLDSVIKRLLTAKLSKEYQSSIETLVSHIFKEMINTEHVDKSLIGDMNQLKKKIKENEKVLQQEQKKQKMKGHWHGYKQSQLPEELTNKLQGRHVDYVKYLYKSFIKHINELALHQKRIIQFVRKLENDLFEHFAGEDQKILKHLQQIRFNMEPIASNPAKMMMLDGEITTKDVIQNKGSTYNVDSRKSSEENEKKSMPTFPKGQGQECEKCKENEAFCERMIQIRAADEPMTRFMHCRGCSYSWTDN